MTIKEEQIIAYHRALLRGCDLDPVRPAAGAQVAWDHFVREMEPLRDTEEGPFTMQDLVELLALMRKQKAEGIGWSMRPTAILRDPEKMIDLILENRRVKRLRQRPPIQRKPITAGPVTAMIDHDPAADPDAGNPISKFLQEYK